MRKKLCVQLVFHWFEETPRAMGNALGSNCRGLREGTDVSTVAPFTHYSKAICMPPTSLPRRSRRSARSAKTAHTALVSAIQRSRSLLQLAWRWVTDHTNAHKGELSTGSRWLVSVHQVKRDPLRVCVCVCVCVPGVCASWCGVCMD